MNQRLLALWKTVTICIVVAVCLLLFLKTHTQKIKEVISEG